MCQKVFFTWLRTFVAKSALLRLHAFREALLTKIWWLGAYKYFIGPVLSYWLTVRLFSTGSTNSLQEASILFQHIILPQVIVLFVECKSFPPHLRTFLSNFAVTDVYALSLKSLPGVFFPFLVWAKFWVALLDSRKPARRAGAKNIEGGVSSPSVITNAINSVLSYLGFHLISAVEDSSKPHLEPGTGKLGIG